MRSLPFVSRLFLFTALALPLSACGSKGGETTNTVAMKNLEVVDGTASDAMTDLDGVKSQGTSTAATNMTNQDETPKAAANSAEASDATNNTEVIADQ